MRPLLIHGVAGAVSFLDGKPFSVAALTVRGGRIVEMDFLTDAERLAELDLTILDDRSALGSPGHPPLRRLCHDAGVALR